MTFSENRLNGSGDMEPTPISLVNHFALAFDLDLQCMLLGHLLCTLSYLKKHFCDVQ